MQRRITLIDLNLMCNRLNQRTGAPWEPYSKQDDGTYKANPGNYHIHSAYGGVNDSAYGGVKLVRMTNTAGGVADVLHSGFVSKRELYSLMHAYLKGLEDKGLS